MRIAFLHCYSNCSRHLSMTFPDVFPVSICHLLMVRSYFRRDGLTVFITRKSPAASIDWTCRIVLFLSQYGIHPKRDSKKKGSLIVPVKVICIVLWISARNVFRHFFWSTYAAERKKGHCLHLWVKAQEVLIFLSHWLSMQQLGTQELCNWTQLGGKLTCKWKHPDVKFSVAQLILNFNILVRFVHLRINLISGTLILFVLNVNQYTRAGIRDNSLSSSVFEWLGLRFGFVWL